MKYPTLFLSILVVCLAWLNYRAVAETPINFVQATAGIFLTQSADPTEPPANRAPANPHADPNEPPPGGSTNAPGMIVHPSPPSP